MGSIGIVTPGNDIRTTNLLFVFKGSKVEAPDLRSGEFSNQKVYKYHYFQPLLIYNIIALGLALGKQMRQLAVCDIFATACIAPESC
jgi:hypothetical protein